MMEEDENRLIAEQLQNEQYGGQPGGSGLAPQNNMGGGAGFGNPGQSNVR